MMGRDGTGDPYKSGFHSNSFGNSSNDDEIELQWAAIERLPTIKRLRSSLFDYSDAENGGDQGKKVVDVIRFAAPERQTFIEKLINYIEEDNRWLEMNVSLLLGPPGCGKTTLLLALAGKLDQSLKVKGEISCNGYKLEEFVPPKTSAYISQYDLHIPEMLVRETLDFSARCLGVGSRAKLMMEVSRRKSWELYQNQISTLK